MREEGADRVGGVMHCFTESQAVADAALDMGFAISFSGIVTFKNATELQEVARRVPLNRMLIETDAPYLAPVPHRGKTNEPAFVYFVAEFLARIKSVSTAEISSESSRAFIHIFKPLLIESKVN
jgi:TatD DNase family protein